MELLTTKEVAAFLKINEKKVYQLIQEGSIPCTRAVGKWLFPREQVSRWLETETSRSHNLLAAGSDDPLLLTLIENFNLENFPKHLIFQASTGSQHGLTCLLTGKADIAGLHLYHPPTGAYNIPFITQEKQRPRVILINLAYRRQGFMVPRGNPLNLKTFTDLARPGLTLANRCAGSGTRLLLDCHLGQAKIDGEKIKGYDNCLVTHLEVGLKVLTGAADVGLGIGRPAAQLGLDFIPLIEERFDIALAADSLSHQPVKKFLSLLTQARLTHVIPDFPGYDFRDTGTVIWEG